MAQPSKTETEKIAPIIVKRVKKVAGGHHGGAWKVAYADFVTAMMAFFLLLWLLNVTTEEQKNAISNYFDPSHPQISETRSGAGGILGGNSMSSEGAQATNTQSLARPDVPNTSKRGDRAGDDVPGDTTDAQKPMDSEQKLSAEQQADQVAQKKAEEDLKKEEDQKFDDTKKQLEDAIKKSPELKELEKNLVVDVTPEGLRIQIVDDKGRSMFARGSAQMYPFMSQILKKVSEVIVPLPNTLSIRGHTDGAAYKTATGYDNWNLSADRAQATRRAMVQDDGLSETRIANVVGRADREHLDTKNPLSERNRRISIILLREDYTDKAKAKVEADKAAAKKKAEEEAARKAAENPLDSMVAPSSAQPPEGEQGTGEGDHKSALPVHGLKGRTMKGVTTSSKRGAVIVIQDDTLPTTHPEKPVEEPVYVNPDRQPPSKVLEF